MMIRRIPHEVTMTNVFRSFRLKRQWYLIYSFIGAFIVLEAGYLLLQHNPIDRLASVKQAFALHSNNHTVTLSDTGFSPKQLQIVRGDKVTFTSSLTKPFWPASDLHPTHTIYAEFDPKQPIEPGQSWSFTFDKTGSWTYHDHLHPAFTGSITVIDSGGDNVAQKTNDISGSRDCSTLQDHTQKVRCWEKNMNTTLKEQGIDAAFETIASLYSQDPTFVNECHSFVHKLGEQAYKDMASRKAFTVSTKSAYCGYGFYHGFMETLLLSGSSNDEARRFCQYAQDQLQAYTKDAQGACYHGIGHGMADNHTVDIWKNERAVADSALQACAQIAPNEALINRCASGVFNLIAIKYNEGKLALKENDPLWFCNQQTIAYFAKPCYEEMNTMLMRLTSNNFAQAVEFIEEVPNDEFAASATRSLAAVAGMRMHNSGSYDSHVTDCRNIQNRLQTDCIGGFAGGLMEGGQPGQEYVKALSYCNSPILSTQESDSCFKEFFWLVSITYPREKYQNICNMVDEKKRQHCTLS